MRRACRAWSAWRGALYPEYTIGWALAIPINGWVVPLPYTDRVLPLPTQPRYRTARHCHGARYRQYGDQDGVHMTSLDPSKEILGVQEHTLDPGYWILDTGYWFLVLDTGYWFLVLAPGTGSWH